jgi:hypothetical protein
MQRIGLENQNALGKEGAALKMKMGTQQINGKVNIVAHAQFATPLVT